MQEKERSPTAPNVQVHSYTPDDIVLSILSKLPIKSFKRFQSVCKLWSLLFDDPYFFNMYKKSFLAKDLSYYDDTSLLLYLFGKFDEGCQHQLYSLSGERFQNRVKLEFPKPFTRNHYGLEKLGSASINGILCLHCKYNDVKKLILWNPTSNELHEIPSSREASRSSSYNWMGSYDHHLIGYDRFKDDYKVVRIIFSYPDLPHISCDLYSLISKSWKKMDDHIHTPRCHSINDEVYMDGVSHWLHITGKHRCLESFDFTTESFITTLLPSYIEDSLASELVILNGSIAFIFHYEEKSTMHISILGEIGVKESWIRLFVVRIPPCLKYLVGSGKNGKIFFETKEQKLFCFDLSTGMVDEISVRGQLYRCNIIFLRKNMLPIRGTYN